MSYTVDEARQALREEAREEVSALVDTMASDGAGVWVKDPEVQGTFGFVKPGTRTAFVVVYSPDLPWMNGSWDFELSDEMEGLLGQA